MAVPITHVGERREGDDDPVVARLVSVYEVFRPELVRRCERIVGSRAAAEEIAQEAFLRAFEHREGIDLDRPLEAWLTTVASRIALDSLRRRRHVLTDALDPRVAELGTGDETFEDVSRRDGRRRLREAMAALPETHRRALVLFGIEGLSYSQIAHAEGMTLGAVKMTLHRARERLRSVVQSSDLFGAVPASTTGTGRGRRALRTAAERVQGAIARAAELPTRLGGLAEGVAQLTTGAAVVAAAAAALLGPASSSAVPVSSATPVSSTDGAGLGTADPVDAPPAPPRVSAPADRGPGEARPDPDGQGPGHTDPRPPDPERCVDGDPRPECHPTTCQERHDCERRPQCSRPVCEVPDPDDVLWGDDGPNLLVGDLVPVDLPPDGSPNVNPSRPITDRLIPVANAGPPPDPGVLVPSVTPAPAGPAGPGESEPAPTTVAITAVEL